MKHGQFRLIKMVSACVCIIMIITLFPASADLGDFKEDTKKEERKGNHGSSTDNSDDDDGGLTEDILNIFADIAFYFWIYANLPVRYSKYPYARKNVTNNFIFRDPTVLADMEQDESVENFLEHRQPEIDPEIARLRKKTRPYFFNLAGGYQRTKDGIDCGFVSMSGKVYKLIGPEIESRYYRDGKDYLSYSMFGVNIPICQFDYISPDFYVGKAMMRGTLRRDGIAYGVNVAAFPFKPVVLHGKIGAIDFDRITYHDYSAHLGVMLKRYEIYGGYRLIKAKYASLKGWEGGIRVWF